MDNDTWKDKVISKTLFNVLLQMVYSLLKWRKQPSLVT